MGAETTVVQATSEAASAPAATARRTSLSSRSSPTSLPFSSS